MFVLSGTLLVVSLAYATLARSIELSRQRLGADIMVVPARSAAQAEETFLVGSAGSFTMPNAAAYQAEVLRSYQGIAAATSQLFVVSAPLPCCSVSDTMIIGFDPATDFVITPWVREWREGRGPQAPDEALVGADILAGTGGRLKLFGREFVIAGKLERTAMPFFDSGIFIPLEGVRAMVRESGAKALRTLTIGQDEISCLLIRLKEGANADRVALQIEHDHRDRKALVVPDMVRKNAASLSVPLKGVTVLVVLQWAASLLLVGVVHAFSVNERRTELGIMKALGATDGNIRSLLLAETLVLAGAASTAGTAAGLLLTHLFAGSLFETVELPIHLPDGALIGAVTAAVLALSLLSGVLPALASAVRASRVEPFT
jgi:putative ABC transport system permease protein